MTIFPANIFTDEQVLAGVLRESADGSSTAWESGRNVQAGYVRGVGVQSGSLIPAIREDLDYKFAIEASQGRSLLNEHALLNLFLIIKYSPLQGNIIEFGSYKGDSALFMAALAKRLRPNCKMFALDTYEGMPSMDQQLDLHQIGQFADTNMAEIKEIAMRYSLDNLIIVKGLFDDSFQTIPPQDAAFFLSHIDADNYASITSAINIARRSSVDYGYLVFDDPLYSTCLGAMFAVEKSVIQEGGLYAEQVYPHLVYRHRVIAA